MLRGTFIGLLMLGNIATYGQWTDHFTDGNFTLSPEWVGEAEKFEIADETLHLNDVAATGLAYLSTPSLAVADAAWEFYVEISENPSSSNFTRIYLMANQADLSGPLNGYFVMVGGSEDEVSLYRQAGSSIAKIIDGTNKRVDTKPVQIRIRVTRDEQGNWELLAQSTSDPDFVAEGTVHDETHTESHYFGVSCRYTSTRKDAFYFDDFVVTGVPQPDTTPPAITSSSVLSATQLQLTFSEAVSTASSQVLSHYEFSSRSVATLQTPDAQTVTLTWSEPLTNGVPYQLRVSNIQDEAGNKMADTTLLVRYFVPVEAQWQDITINEWMPDPNPVVMDLPEAEYIELYNRSSSPFQLGDWTLNDKRLPEYFLLPNQYVILSPSQYAIDFAQYGEVLSLASWPALPNGGSTLLLKDASEEIIDSLTYTEDWVMGGYAIERIRQDQPCDRRLNYGLSLDAQGGTPGTQNSLFTSEPDTQAPTLQQAVAVGSHEVQLHFDEAVTADIQITLSPALEVTRVQTDQTDDTILLLYLAEELVSGTIYSVTVSNARDCYGNEAASLTSRFYYDNQPPAIERVIIRDTASLQIVFDEPLAAVGDKKVYSINNGIGEARSVQWLSDSASVLTEFSASLNTQLTHRLRVLGATDRYGNTADSLIYGVVYRSDVDTVRVVSAYQVNILFSGPLDLTSAQSTKNYHIDRGLEQPSAAIMLSSHEIQLIYDHPLSANKVHELRIENLVDATGAYLSTPVYRFAYDQKAPSLDSIVVTEGRTLMIYFDEEVAWDTGKSTTAFSVDQSIGSPERVELLPDKKSFKLYLSHDLTPETTYELSVIGLADKSGNVISSLKKATFLYDQHPPSLHRWQLISSNQLLLEFHEPLTTLSALDPQNYTLASGTVPDSVAVSSINPKNVTLFFADFLPDAATLLWITGVSDQHGNRLTEPIEITVSNQVPAIGAVIPRSATELQINFTKPVDATMMTSLANYRLDSLTMPTEAVVSGLHQASVTLHWADPLPAETQHTLFIQRLADSRGAVVEEVTTRFTYRTKVASVTNDDAGLTIEFSVPVDPTAAVETSNYEMTEMGNPVAAILVNPQMVRLVFAQPFNEQTIYTLTLDRLLDQDKGIIPQSQHTVGRGLTPGYHQLLVTELMADPSPAVGLPEVEYIELYNASDHLLNTQGVQFSDASTTVVLPTALLAPHEYVILSSASDQAALSRFSRTISVNKLPTLNSSGDSLRLTDAYGQEVFSIVYSDDWYNDAEKRNGGWSLEMVDPQRPCGEQDNWVASVDLSGGTPGGKNSVHQANPDQFGPEVLQAVATNDTVVRVTFSEKLDAASTRSAQIQLSDGLIARSIQWMPARKEVIIILPKPLRPRHNYSVRIEGVTDCSGNLIRNVANTTTFVLPEQAADGDMLLSELLFYPRSGGEKFVELYNHSDKQIDLKDWYLANVFDDSLVNEEIITHDHYLLAPGDYVALTEDPAILQADYPASSEAHLLRVDALPSLPADEGTLVLIAPFQEIMQQFHYADRYHHPLLTNTRGVSLERTAWSSQVDDPTLWQSAAKTVNYATPGYRNSQQIGTIASAVTLTVDPPVFAPGYAGQSDYTRIHYQFHQPGTVANVIIYDAQGRKVRELARNTTLAEAGFLVWDGTGDDHHPAGIGYYLIFFETFDTQGRVNVFKEKVVVGGF